jgi:hypothetical protein
MRLSRPILGLALAGATLLAGCAGSMPGVTAAPPPLPRPDESLLTASASPASAELADYYARVQNGLLQEGMLRTDRGGPDVPFSTRDLVRNFLKIALYEEYSDAGGRLVARENASRLHRWVKPVTISVDYGASVPQARRSRDSVVVSSLVRRIGAATGHPVSEVAPGSGNFRVFVVNEDERRALAPKLRAIMPDISTTALNTIVNLPRSTYCLVFATTEAGSPGTYSQAIAVIRSEHPDLLRASCYHEEITQGFGLANDFALARPSIFNDDEEFAFLTTHDELLLKMLYDRRLIPGMTEAQARPIVERIAAELMGGNV